MAVEIIADTANLLKVPASGCLVAAVPDYVPAVQRIKQAVKADQSLQVVVRDSTCAVWLHQLADSYPDSQVRYTAVSARALLAERWRTSIPDSVTDEAILASGFLQADIVPKSDQSYTDIVLTHYWSEFFTFVTFPSTKAAELVESLDPTRWEANRRLPLVMQALEECKQRWLKQAKRREQREFIAAIFDDPQVLKVRIGSYKLVRRYPADVGQVVLGKWHALFKNLNLDPTPVSLGSLDLKQAVQQIVYYLNNLSSQIKGLDDLETTLDQMSGCLPEEFVWVKEQLQTKSEILPVTEMLLQHIADRFRPIQAQIRGAMESLQATIPPAYPTVPVETWEADEWLCWAVHEYLPYRFWLEENDRWDETVAGYASAYADWFYEHYTMLKYQHQSRWVFDVLNQIGIEVGRDCKVLLVVIDNFNFKYVGTLVDRFAGHGFRVVGNTEPVWAVIPTTTEVSKYCLVAGEPDLQEIQGHGYEDILEKDWRDRFEGYRLVYLPKLGDLQKRQQFDADLILLNYLPIDDVLHKDEKQIGTTHTGEIRIRLEALVEAVCQFAQRTKVEQELVIAIASDHGSTKMLPEAESPLDDKFYQRQAVDRHHRYISVPQARADTPTSYDQEHCYVLPAKSFGTIESYFVPKGYGVFVKTDESIYVHGGLTPEETIVPFLRLMKTEIQVLQPTFHLPVNVIRYGVKAGLVFSVGNPNDYDLTSVELEVNESDLPGVRIDAIPAGRSIEVTIPVRIRRQPGAPDLTAITIQGDFDLQGRRYDIQPVGIPVEIRSLMESKTGFDFDF